MADAVSFQRIRTGLLIKLDERSTIYELKNTLNRRLDQMEGFFDRYPAVLHCGARDLREIDLNEIAGIIINDFRIDLLQVISTVPAVREYGAKLGCATYETLDRSEYSVSGGVEKSQTLWIRRHVRNGQKIEFAGNIVIVGDVNAGAEIIATGNIIIMGACRGIVHAGSDGDTQSVIIACRLIPTQIKIAYLISRTPDSAADTPMTFPEVAHIRHDAILIENYKKALEL